MQHPSALEAREKYTYPYRAANWQGYILKHRPDGWKVFQNPRPLASHQRTASKGEVRVMHSFAIEKPTDYTE